MGHRFTDEFMVSLTYTIEQVKAEILGTDVPLNLTRQAGLTSSLRTTLSYDTRNNRLFPSKGNYTTLSVEYATDGWGARMSCRTVARHVSTCPCSGRLSSKPIRPSAT